VAALGVLAVLPVEAERPAVPLSGDAPVFVAVLAPMLAPVLVAAALLAFPVDAFSPCGTSRDFFTRALSPRLLSDVDSSNGDAPFVALLFCCDAGTTGADCDAEPCDELVTVAPPSSSECECGRK
jgi:hypothetical protein